jgi:hypothetical protein
MNEQQRKAIQNAVAASQEALQVRPFWHKRIMRRKHADLPAVGLKRRKVRRKQEA